MESKLKDNKPNIEPSIFEMLMVVCGITGLFSAMMWTLTGLGDEEPSRWLWFSRFTLGIICFGFAGVMRAIRKSKN